MSEGLGPNAHTRQGPSLTNEERLKSRKSSGSQRRKNTIYPAMEKKSRPNTSEVKRKAKKQKA